METICDNCMDLNDQPFIAAPTQTICAGTLSGQLRGFGSYFSTSLDLDDNGYKYVFLSEPGPIILYPSQWLTHSLTNWLTDDLVEDWMNWPKYADFADYVDYAEYA